MKPTRVGVLVSGNGSNLEAILKACRSKKIDAEVVLVVSNNPKAYALERAKKFKVPTFVVNAKENFETEVLSLLKQYNVELVCLAGFMRLLSKHFIQAYPNRILNIHPALLPAFPGLKAQKQAYDYGAKITGVTVHFVDEGCDTGPIILQKAIPILDSDTEETLFKRIQKVEHQIYPQAIQLFATGCLKINGRRVLRE